MSSLAQGPDSNLKNNKRHQAIYGEEQQMTKNTGGNLTRRAFTTTAAMFMASVAMPEIGWAADAKVLIAFTPTAAAAGIFNAQAEGFFAKRGLANSELLPQANGVAVVAAVQSGSAQIGSVAAGVFFGAIEHGLDYVALGCQSLFGPGTEVLAAIARNGVPITKAADFAGKRVAVPGLNGGHHIMFLEWLRENGVDAKDITFLEVNHAQQADVLRGKTIDAVVTAEPHLTRVVEAGLGTVVSRLNDTKRNMPDAFFMTTRAWADANPDAAKAFQAALQDGVEFAKTNQPKTQENTALYLKQDIAVVRQAGQQNLCTTDLRKHVGELNSIMLDLKLSKKPMDPDVVVWRHP
jgi:NitT/TauT family transport system substrate-binding protein